MKPYKMLLCLTIAVLLFAGCSSSTADPASPAQVIPTAQAGLSGKTLCMGLWQFAVDLNAEKIEITQLRGSDLALNVLGFLEPPPLTKLNIANLEIDSDNALISVDVLFTHPLQTPENTFHGFDVRGIVIGPNLLNPDGATEVMSPEFFSGVPFGYQDGLLGAPDSYADYSGIFGYKYFADDLGPTDDLGEFFTDPGNLDARGIFTEGTTNSRHYDLSWQGLEPPLGFVIFNYAVYANYNWPVGDPPFDIDDFSITTANSAEAFCGKITQVDNSLWYFNDMGGGSISLDVEIFDWQGLESTEVSIFADSVPETAYDSTSPGATAYSEIYHFVDIGATPAAAGILAFYIKAADPETFGSAWFLGLLPESNPKYDENIANYFLHWAVVSESPPPIVDAIDPNVGGPGQNLTDVTVTGSNFIDGPHLAVALKMAGETDINATNETWVSSTEITCDINIPSGTEGGSWDVEVTNGCGSKGTGIGLFGIISCGSISAPASHYSVITGGDSVLGYVAGMAATQSGTPYAIGIRRFLVGYPDYVPANNRYLAAMPVSLDSGSPSIYSDPTNVASIDRDIVCDSQNNVYFTDSSDYTRVRYFPFNGTFGTLVNFGNITSGWTIWRITIDENDYPVVLAISGSSMQVFHWNGASWDTTAVPSSVIQGSTNSVTDFDWNPMLDHYVFVRTMGSTANMYAVNTSGALVSTSTDIFNGNSFNSQAGIYIDVLDPECRILTWGSFTSYGSYNNPWARFNAAYGDKIVSTTLSTNYSYGAINSSRGQWAKGSTEFIVGCHYINVYAKVHLPGDW